MSVHHIFVYGSLRSGFQSPAYEYISRYFTLVSNAKVKGKLFSLPEYPAAIPANDESYIIGELYRINNEKEFGWALAQLDDYEGVNVELGETPLYRREEADVLLNGTTVNAWIYWYNKDVTGHPQIASGDLLEYLANKNH